MIKLDANKIQRIMIRSANWLGDAVMTVPAMMAARETYPDAHIAVVANPLVAQLLENHPGCDEVIVYNKRAEHVGVLGRFSPSFPQVFFSPPVED